MGTFLQVNVVDKLTEYCCRVEQTLEVRSAHHQGDGENISLKGRSGSLSPHSWGILWNLDVLALLFAFSVRLSVHERCMWDTVITSDPSFNALLL